MEVKNTAILVTGMHRSGTSLVTQILHLHGIAVSKKLEPANQFNVTGYWESAALIKLHENMLREAHSSWRDVGELPPSWFKSALAKNYANDIASKVLGDFLETPLFAIKDPRISRFLPLWEDILNSRNIGVKVLIPFRNPYAVAKSLQHRNRMHRHRSMLLWSRHILDAERFSRHLDRTFVNYDALIADWEAVIGRAGDDMGIVFPLPSKNIRQAVDAAILESENHYKQPSPRENADDIEMIAWDIYQAVLARDQVEIESVLDKLRVRVDAYCHWISPILNSLDIEVDTQAAAIREQLATDIEQLHLAIEQSRSETERLQIAIKHSDAEVEQWLLEAEQSNAKVEKLSADCNRSAADNKKLQRIIDQSNIEIERLQIAIKRSSSEADQWLHEVEQSNAKVEVLSADCNRSAAENKKLQRVIDQSKAEIERLQIATKQLNTEVEQLNAKVENLLAEAKRSASENEHLQAACRQAEADRDGQQRQAEDIAQNLIVKELEIDRYQEKIQGLIRTSEEQLEQKEELQSYIVHYQTMLERAENELESVQEQVQVLTRTSDQQVVQKEELQSYIVHYQIMLERAEAELEKVYAGHSWRLTAPIRAVRRSAGLAMNFVFDLVAKLCTSVGRYLALPTRTKNGLKDMVFGITGSLFDETDVYRAWQAQKFNAQSGRDVPKHLQPGLIEPSLNAVYQKPLTPPEQLEARLIAFYLPQFHAIPENDEWWGEGFTEWVNVQPAEPQFAGHYQPHVPGELGYYNLLDKDVQASQIELAKLYGVQGFCFYFYWFGGKRLLEAPVANYFSDPDLDLPACLCWANENWSRRWDGLDEDILIGQEYSPGDDIAFIEHIAQYLRNSKYIRVQGRPLVLVYRPLELPNPKATSRRWRDWCRENGIGEIYLAYTQSFEVADPAEYGFDAAIEFPPNNSAPPELTSEITPYKPNYSGHVYDWRIFLERSNNYVTPDYMLYRSVCPSWDNTARKKERGACFANSNPADYQAWLENAVADTSRRISNKDDRLVFVNAWNEWAEGAHLEPDERYGYAYLDATRKALTKNSRLALCKILLVTHDAHPHGAQLLVLNMAKLYVSMGVTVSILVAGEGPLVEEYTKVASVKVLAGDKSELPEYLASLVSTGYQSAIVNSVASGWVVDSLNAASMKVISLVHELPSIIKSMKLEDCARTMVKNSQLIVFASETVREGFSPFLSTEVSTMVMPQGLYKRNETLLQQGRDYCRAALREKYSLAEDALVVIAVGGADLRKGIDLFVEAANIAAAKNRNIYFIWVGKVLEDARPSLEALLPDSPVRENIFIEDCWQDTDIFYGGGDVYALTSREDPFPSVVLEAFDAEMPVVAFDGCGGFTDIVQESTGCLVEPLDVQQYSQALLDILSDPVARASKGRAGKAIIEHQFSFYRYGYNLLELSGVKLKRVTAVLPNYNYADFMQDRISSLCNQTHPLYELIVLDDCSTDNSREVIEKAISTLAVPVKFIVNDDNSGSVFKQWEKGAELAEGDYVWIAEADDVAEPNFLERVCGPLDNGDVVLSYCQSTQMAEDGTQLAPDYFPYTNDISTQRWREDYTNDGLKEIAEALCVKNTIPNASAVIFEKNALRSALLNLRESYPDVKVAGDWLVYLSVLQKGKIAYSAKALNHHRRHDSSVTSLLDAEKHYQEVRDTQLLAREMTRVDKAVVTIADDYARHLIDHFGIADEAL